VFADGGASAFDAPCLASAVRERESVVYWYSI